MSLLDTKNQLIHLLADKDIKVIALSGLWGTGKSYMWEDVKKTSADELVRKALYVSLFGITSVDQVKIKLMQSAAPDDATTWMETAKTAARGLTKVLEGFHKSFAALSDLGALAAPLLLRGKLVVIDDVERKHDKLGIDELMGFINEFSKQHGARFLLILNSDQLNQGQVWNTLREKVIDQELRLSTSTKEAFDIAIQQTASPWTEHIRGPAAICGLTNIRILCKTIKVVNKILDGRKSLSNAVLARLISPAVLLAAIHYKGLKDGPDFQFVLAQGTAGDWGLSEGGEAAKSPEGRRKARWKVLLKDLGMHDNGPYELEVITFLESGLLDPRALARAVDDIQAQASAWEARARWQQFDIDHFWNHRLTDQQRLEQARAVAASARMLDRYAVTRLYTVLQEIPGAHTLADQAVNDWIAAYNENKPTGNLLDDPFGGFVHPKISAAIQASDDHLQANTSALDACRHIAEHNGWGTRQEAALRSASIDSFESIIRNATRDDLRLLMRQMIVMCDTTESNIGALFKPAPDHFIQACHRIVIDPDSPRLAKLIKSLFATANLALPPDPATASLPEAAAGQADRAPEGLGVA